VQPNDGRQDNSNGSESGLGRPVVSQGGICSIIDLGEELLSSSSFQQKFRPQCAKYFRLLNAAVWICPVESGEESNCLEMDGARKLDACLGCGKPERLLANILLRIAYIELCWAHRSMVEAVAGNGTPRVSGKKVTNAPPITSSNTESLSFSKFTLHKIREGQRWLELIEAVGGGEILLIDDHDYAQDHYNDDEQHSDDDKSLAKGDDVIDEDHDRALDIDQFDRCFFQDGSTMMVAKIVDEGTDAVFTKLKAALLPPDLQLKETCLRLSGLISMTYHSLKAPNGSALATFLGREVSRRLKGSFWAA
jgi:hypothetical protein